MYGITYIGIECRSLRDLPWRYFTTWRLLWGHNLTEIWKFIIVDASVSSAQNTQAGFRPCSCHPGRQNKQKTVLDMALGVPARLFQRQRRISVAPTFVLLYPPLIVSVSV